jgi:glucose-1-phosphate adenylyltransferase
VARDRILAIVLAGGAGSRMDVLTRERAKPALPFAGTYRLIDFPLSNLHHSGIDDVWVSVQYQARTLDEDVANGRPWDLDRTRGGLRLLPPEEGIGGAEEGFAQGNADVLFRQRDLIRAAAPEVVLVLSADHVYRFDYADAIATHRAADADCTIVTSRVPREQAANHATVGSDRSGRVRRFAYKPKRPRTGVVATEVFVYQPSALLETLEQLHRELDPEADGGSGLGDFGEQLLPRLVDEATVVAHPMTGYWRDVGRPSTYLAAHRDVLTGRIARLDDPDWPILSRDLQRAPAHIHPGARVADSLISPGCSVYGSVVRSVLGPGVHVERGATVTDSVVFSDAVVETGARVAWSVLDRNVRVEGTARVGGRPRGDLPDDEEITLVGKDAVIGSGVRVPRGGRLEPGTTA